LTGKFTGWGAVSWINNERHMDGLV